MSRPPPSWVRWRLLLAAGFCGCAVMIMELTATRALAPVFGTSLFTWTNVIAVVLLALSLGYWTGGRVADRHPEQAVLGWLILAASLLTLPAPFLTKPVGRWLLPPPRPLSDTFTADPAVWGSLGATLLLFAPPLFFLGMVAPFVTRCLADSGLDSGGAAGRTLAASTLGSLLGTFLPAHVLIEWAGVRTTLLTGTGVLGAAGLLLLLGGRGRVAPTAP